MDLSSIRSPETVKMDPDSCPVTSKPEQHRLNSLKADIHDKGSLLSSTWNDLYQLLSQYQAELFISETPQGDTEFRRDFIDKEAQLSQLQHRLNLAETEIESVRLDLTVKNSLLHKYQDDLLDKESALLACQSRIRRLENKQTLSENRMMSKASRGKNGTETINGEEKPVTPNKPNKGSLIDASISAISQKRKANASYTSSKRKSTPPTQNLPQTPKDEPQLPQDDFIQRVLDDVIENREETTTIHQVKSEPLECVQLAGESMFPQHEEAPLPLEQYENWQNDALAQATGEVVTSIKKSSRYDPLGYPCPTCHRIFTRQTHRKRHIDTMHSQIKRHHCNECGRGFARKDYLTKHFVAHHPELCGDFLCPICGKKCLCQDDMTTHIYQSHSVLTSANDADYIKEIKEVLEAERQSIKTVNAVDTAADLLEQEEIDDVSLPLMEKNG